MTSSPAHPPARRTSAFVAYAIGILLAGALTAWLFPPSFLRGEGLFFFDGDISKDISGWIFFAHDTWHWPLLHTSRLNAPEGLSIAFTDSIPLLALLFKPWAGHLPVGFHYFGMWHALAFVLQATGAVFLIRSLRFQSAFAALCAAAFALTWPILLFRFGHSALLAQGLLLFSLGCYFRAQQAGRDTSDCAVALILLCQIALLVHPYLMAMCYAIFIAFLIDDGRHEGAWLVQLRRLIIALAITLLLMALLGYFGGGLSAGGYGNYTLSVNSLWCGGESSVLFSCDPGPGEHYAYLGAGVLLLLVLAAVLCGARLPGLLRAHAGLVLVCILLVAFALSHHIYLGSKQIASYPLPAWLVSIFSVFQASARFVWPVTYLLLFAGLACMLRRGVGGALVLIAAFAIQWYDTDIRREQIRLSARAAEQPFDSRWEAALQGVRHIKLFPAFGCGELDSLAYMPIQYLAAIHGITLNTAYAARSKSDCQAKHAVFQHPIMAADTLYLAPAALPAQALPPLFRAAVQHGDCSQLTVTPILWGVSRPQDLLACHQTTPIVAPVVPSSTAGRAGSGF